MFPEKPGRGSAVGAAFIPLHQTEEATHPSRLAQRVRISHLLARLRVALCRTPVRAEVELGLHLLFSTAGNWIKNCRDVISSKPSGEGQIPISCTTIHPLPVFEMHFFSEVNTFTPSSQMGCSKAFECYRHCPSYTHLYASVRVQEIQDHAPSFGLSLAHTLVTSRLRSTSVN